MDQVKDWSLGLELLEKIEQSDHFQVNTQNDDVETGLDEHKKALDLILVNLEKPRWSTLIKSLLKEYKNLFADTRVEALDEQMDCDESPQNRLTNTSFINRLIHIDMKAEEEEEQHGENPMQVDEVVASLSETLHGSGAELEKIPANDTIPKPTEESNDMAEIRTSESSKDITVPILEDKTDVEMPEVSEESTLKRKREEEENDGNNSENGEDSENDEDEAEEKRLSLR